jgi:hypothetical protein
MCARDKHQAVLTMPGSLIGPPALGSVREKSMSKKKVFQIL